MNFLESSLSDLYQSAVEAFPKTQMRQHATHDIVITNLHWMPFVGMKTLFIRGLANQNEGREYSPIILIKKVHFLEKGGRVIKTDGQNYFLEQISFNNDVLLRCNCADFSFRFNFYDYTDKSLYGRKRKKYESKGGPPANPMKMPGMCKHLLKLIEVLKNDGIFQ